MIPGELDPPAHTKLRKLMIPHFTDRALAPWREGIAKIIAEAFEAVLPDGEADLVKDIAHPVPVLVISLVLGIESDWRTIRELAANFLDATGIPSWRVNAQASSRPFSKSKSASDAGKKPPICWALSSTPRLTESRSLPLNCSVWCSSSWWPGMRPRSTALPR